MKGKGGGRGLAIFGDPQRQFPRSRAGKPATEEGSDYKDRLFSVFRGEATMSFLIGWESGACFANQSLSVIEQNQSKLNWKSL